MKKFLLNWTINTLGVFVAFYIVHGIHSDTWVALLVASLLLGIFNAILRPVLVVLAMPLLILTLGLFTLVINAFLLYLVSALMRPHFFVDGFVAAFWGALVISIISLILNVLTGNTKSRVRVRHHRPPPSSDSDGGGPIIDV